MCQARGTRRVLSDGVRGLVGGYGNAFPGEGTRGGGLGGRWVSSTPTAGGCAATGWWPTSRSASSASPGVPLHVTSPRTIHRSWSLFGTTPGTECAAQPVRPARRCRDATGAHARDGTGDSVRARQPGCDAPGQRVPAGVGGFVSFDETFRRIDGLQLWIDRIHPIRAAAANVPQPSRDRSSAISGSIWESVNASFSFISALTATLNPSGRVVRAPHRRPFEQTTSRG